MYHHLRGKLIAAGPTQLVLETAGVGWDILAPLSTTGRLGKAGDEVLLYTHLQVREDALQLYGFATEEERLLFRTLIGLSGIGPSTALQILSSAAPQDFILAIEKQDTQFLTRIKGIGAKTAKRIILELKGAKTLLPEEGELPRLEGDAADAVAALEAMGVNAKEAVARVDKVLARGDEPGLEALIKQALQG